VTSFTTELATPTVTGVRTDTLPRLIYKDNAVVWCWCVIEIGEDVSEKKDGGVVRSQLQKGEGYLTPKEGATCDGIISHSALLLLYR